MGCRKESHAITTKVSTTCSTIIYVSCYTLFSLAETTSQISPKRLTYYKREELESLLALPVAPHLLLTHDWPKEPAGAHANFPTRPESHLVETLRPQYVCCGHHHRAEAFRLAASECRALSIIQDREPSDRESIRPGWAWVCRWDPTTCSLSELGYWPPLPAAVGSE